MEHWQFLIQKQGERSWQSLESPTLKILTGKYRVLARSSLLNTDVDVRVSHSSIYENPPQQRVFKRLRRTNENGLMAVIPFTDLKPGIWELRCSGDLMTDMLGESWQYSLFLNVMPLDVHEQLLLDGDDLLGTEIDSIEEEENESPTSINTAIDIDEDIKALPISSLEDDFINQPISPVLFKGETAEQIVQNLIDLALPSAEDWEEEPVEENVTTVASSFPLQLSLEQDNYIAEWGKVQQINGTVDVDAKNIIDLELSDINHVYQPQIEIELRSPQESTIIKTSKQDLVVQSLPFTFTTSVEIPQDCESKLILGNINLYGRLNPDGEFLLVANCAFTITANVTELLTVTSQSSEPADSLVDDQLSQLEDSENIEPPRALDLKLFELARSSNLHQLRSLKPAVKKPLPPKVQPILLSDNISPQLPQLPRVHKSLISSDFDDVEESTGNQVKPPSYIPPINLEKLAIRQVKTSFPFLKKLQPPEPEKTQPLVVENTLQLIPENEDHPQLDLELPEDTETEETILNSQELASQTAKTSPLIEKWMATHGYLLDPGMELIYPEPESEFSDPEITVSSEDSEEEKELSTDSSPLELPEHLRLDLDSNADLEAETFSPLELPEHLLLDGASPTPSLPLEPEPKAWLSEEVVLDDVDITPDFEEDHQPSPTKLENLASQELVFIPTPRLFLPDVELLAGGSVAVRLEVPQTSAKIIIKLWIEDYQTRDLLEGPYLLKDLHLTPWGKWEVVTTLIVPLGCLQVLIGAIALDVDTEQESHKVTMVKTVIPANLPKVDWDQMLDF